MKGAYKLSGLPEPGSESTQHAKSDYQSSKASGTKVDIGTDTTTSSAKTIVKRPRKLAVMKKQTRYIRNHFGMIAEIVYSPVASVLTALISASTKTQPLPDHSIDLTDIIRHSRANETSPSVLEVSNKPTRVQELNDGIDLLLPAQCMLALANFTRCSINSTSQRYIPCA